MPVSCECYVLSGRSVCVGPITHSEKSYRVSECNHEAPVIRRAWPTGGCCTMG
jgi:hypothetical protein